MRSQCSQTSAMTRSLLLRFWCSLIALLCLSSTHCKSDPEPTDIVTEALACFNDHYVYSSCEESYRLKAEGTLHVPPEGTDEFCDGPCLAETKLVLNCIDHILYNFKFYNGASIRDVRYTLYSGCGHTNKRGDFDVTEHLGADHGEYGDYYDYNHANKLAIPGCLLILFSCVLLWV